jgi:hypothetical protein
MLDQPVPTRASNEQVATCATGLPTRASSRVRPLLTVPRDPDYSPCTEKDVLGQPAVGGIEAIAPRMRSRNGEPTVGHFRFGPLVFATLGVGCVTLSAVVGSPSAAADNVRLNNSIASNVYTIHRQAGCPGDVKINPQLRLAAQWHTNDVLNNRALDGDIGSDGSTVQDRARNAGYSGVVAETVAITSYLAVNALDAMGDWYFRPDYFAIMSNCAFTQIGVWSENSLDRSVLVAVYGQPV